MLEPKFVVPFAVNPLSRGGVYVNTPVELLYAIAPLPRAEPSDPTERSVSAMPPPPPPEFVEGAKVNTPDISQLDISDARRDIGCSR